MNNNILYIGGFQLPDKNAAAQRVVGIAKGLCHIGYNVIFLNSLKKSDGIGVNEKEYFGFKCFEYKRENSIDYMISAKTVISMIKKIKPFAVIAYNYPAVALNSILRYCHKNGIKCFADVTEWYDATGNSILYRFIKWSDICFRMKYVHKRMDGVITISRYLYDYYKEYLNTVLIPPTVDIEDKKWAVKKNQECNSTVFVYAGVPSKSKERLDKIVEAVIVVEKEHNVHLNIVGINEEEFINIYKWKGSMPTSISFWGRVDHTKAIEIVKNSDWTIILRDDNRLVRAGFPTKLVESISCGTPVIVNRFSNIFDYLSEDNSICVERVYDLQKYFALACNKKIKIDSTIFDYRIYCKELIKIFNN